MSIDKNEIQKIAHLARLSIEPEDIPLYADNLSNILHLVDRMNEVDTSQVVPLAHPLDTTQRLRADVVTADNQRDIFQANAPQVENGYYLVPKVIE